jgi:hypothetical protein
MWQLIYWKWGFSCIYACSPPFGRGRCRVGSWHGSLVMGGQGSGVFSTGTSWFCDFLAISGLCAPWVPAPGNVGEGGFPLPDQVFFTLYQLTRKQGFWDIIPLNPCLVLEHPTQPLNHNISIHMLILFLQIMGHCGEYETAYIERIITMLLMSSAICSTRTSREVLRVRLWKK